MPDQRSLPYKGPPDARVIFTTLGGIGGLPDWSASLPQLLPYVTSAITFPELSSAATMTSRNIARDDTDSMSPYAKAVLTIIQQPLQADQLNRGEGVWPTCSRGQRLSLGPPAQSLLRLSPTLADCLPNLGRFSKMPHNPGFKARPPFVLELLTMRLTTQHIAQREE